MRDTMKLLMDLQELELILHESSILHADGNVSAEEKTLQDRCQLIRMGIPADILRRYDQLRSVGLGVTREINGCCNACRLNITIGDLTRMRNGKINCECPNCGLFLLLSD